MQIQICKYKIQVILVIVIVLVSIIADIIIIILHSHQSFGESFSVNLNVVSVCLLQNLWTYM